MIESNIESQKSLIYKKDIKFYGVDKIVKMASIVEKFSKECSVCIQKKTEIEDISKNLGNYLNNSVKLRKEYEHLSDEITEHLKTEHQIFSKTYFASLYSAYGTIAGLLAGFIFGFIFFILGKFNLGKLNSTCLGNSGTILSRLLSTNSCIFSQLKFVLANCFCCLPLTLYCLYFEYTSFNDLDK